MAASFVRRRGLVGAVAAAIIGFSLPVTAGMFGRSVLPGESVKATLKLSKPAGPPVVVDVAKFGTLKQTLQPWHFRIFIAVANDTAAPMRIGFKIEDCRMFFDWSVRNYTWDEASMAIAEPLPAGAKLTLYLFTEVPQTLRREAWLCDGRLVAFDAADGRPLVTHPLRIANGIAPAAHHPAEHTHDGAQHVD